MPNISTVSDISEVLGYHNDGRLLVQLDDGRRAAYEPATGSFEFIDEVRQPEPKLPQRKLINDLEMDITDLLYHLFKGQPRIVGANLYQYERLVNGQFRYQREISGFRGNYTVYYKRNAIAYMTVKPHKSMTLLPVSKQGRINFAQAVLVRVMYSIFPEVKVKQERYND